MKITINDLAKEAGVSIASISRYLNNKYEVSNKTISKIEKAIEKLNYKPYASAHILSIQTIGILIPDINNLYYLPVTEGIEAEMQRNDFNIFICHTNNRTSNNHIENLIEKKVDGFIFYGPLEESKRPIISELSKNKPVLIINDDIMEANVYSVMTDSVRGAYQAIKYLIKLGHKKIGFINGSTDYLTYRNKLSGYKKALTDNNLPIEKKYIVHEEPHEAGGYSGLNKLLELKERPTAIFTASDQMAIGVMRACYERNLKIPDDVSLIGFSDIRLASELSPRLTTVNQFPYDTGRIAAETILKVIKKDRLSQRMILIEPKVSIRESCKSLVS